MGPYYLSDTNTIIEFLGGAFPKEKAHWLQRIIDKDRNYLSVINQIELLGFDASSDEIKTIEAFIGEMKVIPLSEEIVKRTIMLRRSLRIKLPDAIIAATALVNNLILVTRNTADFKNIPGLLTLNLWEFTPESE